MDLGDWGRTALEILDGAPALWGVVVFLVAVAGLAARSARARRRLARPPAKSPAATPQAES